MQKTQLKYVIGAISVAIFGLASLQIYWIVREANLQARKFDQAVFEAMGSAAHKIERIAMLNNYKTGFANPVQEMFKQLFQKQQSVSPKILNNDTVVINQLNGSSVLGLLEDLFNGEQDKQAFVLDSNTINTIIAKELAFRGIESKFNYLLGSPYKPKDIVTNNKAKFDQIVKSPYQIPLFSNSIFSNPNYLVLHFPHKNTLLIKTIVGSLLVSLLFIGIIIFAFIYSIKTIFNQKRIELIRTDFINNITHELKTPVATISLASEAISSMTMTEENARMARYTGVIKDEAKRLQKLIENILTNSISEKGGFKLNLELINVAKLFEDLNERSKVLLEDTQGTLRIINSSNISEFEGDYLHLSNALFNLIDNAIKYCKKVPEIHIEITGQQKLMIQVSDNGIGIAKENLHKIFESMYRVPTGNVHDVKGFGLGLSYCKNVILKHKGSINLKSELNQGSNFIIELPISQSTK